MQDYNNLVNALQEAGLNNNIISSAREQQKQDIIGGVTPIGSILGIEGLKAGAIAAGKQIASQGLQKVAGVSAEQAQAIVNGDLGALKNAAINLIAKKAGVDLPENASIEDIGNAVKSLAIKTVGERTGLNLTGNETPEEILNIAKSAAIKSVGEKAGIEGLTGNETPEQMLNLIKTNALEQISTKAGITIPEGATPEDIISTLSEQAPEVLARAGIVLPSGEASALDVSGAIRSAVASQINEATGLSLTGLESTPTEFASAIGKLAAQTIAQKTGIAIPENLEFSQEGIINGLKSFVASKIESVTGVKINPDASVDEIGNSLLEQGRTIVSDQISSVTGTTTGEIALPSFEIPSAFPSISLPTLSEFTANPLEALSSTLSDAVSQATQVVSGATEAISGATEAVSSAVSGATQAVSSATEAVSGASEAVSAVSQSVNALGQILPASVFSPVLASDRLAPTAGIMEEEDLASQAARMLSQPSQAIQSTTPETIELPSLQTGEGSIAPISSEEASTATSTEASATGEAVATTGETTAVTAGETAAEVAGVTAGDVFGIVGSALGPLGLIAALGTSIYSIFEGTKHEDLGPVLNPSVQFGV